MSDRLLSLYLPDLGLDARNCIRQSWDDCSWWDSHSRSETTTQCVRRIWDIWWVEIISSWSWNFRLLIHSRWSISWSTIVSPYIPVSILGMDHPGRKWLPIWYWRLPDWIGNDSDRWSEAGSANYARPLKVSGQCIWEYDSFCVAHFR